MATFKSTFRASKTWPKFVKAWKNYESFRGTSSITLSSFESTHKIYLDYDIAMLDFINELY